MEAILFTTPAKRQSLEHALAQFMESEIAAKQGVEGKVIQSFHANAKRLIPGVLTRGITYTLPGLIADLETEYRLMGSMSFGEHILRPDRRPFVIAAIRRAFDRVIAQYHVLVPLYQLIKGRVEYHVGLALPRLGMVVDPFLVG